ncbi:PREDICTED: axoneme-associated protein mst101(2)-like [Dinoponera quadriceps]|uniref:Axoneme-associated protein mst101(2)-like n=1 Tax=Dinoponera quadriceps TaxID=609295 RepID=A0A6P3WSS4_DINQU|nr:PREDICTED: axoneme-associated protein mst101(2)-like [Dinoponera quadriceps]
MVEDQPSVPESSDKTSQKHKEVDTRDVDSPRRYQSANTDEEERGLTLWCAKCHRAKKKKCRELELGKSTRRLLKRIKKRSKEECEKPDDEAVAGVSTAPHRESISRRSAPEKSKRSRKQDAVEMADKDVTEKTKKVRRASRRDEEEARKRRKEERKKRREKREREERIPRVVDAQPAAPTEILKSCCYLCAQNTLAIAGAAAGFKPEQSDKCIQVSAHKFHEATSALDKSCSAIVLVRTVQSSVKVKTREISTLCPGMSVRRKDTEPKTKRKKLSVFPRLTWTKCPARRHVACETDKSAKRDNAEKRERPKYEKCCDRKKNA